MAGSSGGGRIWELDFLRGLAILIMVFFHLVYDLKEIYNLNVSYEVLWINLLGKSASSLFIIISGISSTLGSKTLKRAIIVFLGAAAVSISTYIFDSEFFVVFGILHFFTVAMLLSILFKKADKYILLGTSAVIFAVYLLVPMESVNTNLFMMLGFHNRNFSSADYFPLIPYFGIFLVGMFLGRTLYKQKKSLLPAFHVHELLAFPGRHSLIIYLLHQPLLLLILRVVIGKTA